MSDNVRTTKRVLDDTKLAAKLGVTYEQFTLEPCALTIKDIDAFAAWLVTQPMHIQLRALRSALNGVRQMSILHHPVISNWVTETSKLLLTERV